MTKAPPKRGLAGVDNAARTRDLLNHNQLLYRLSYIHHVCHPVSRIRTTDGYYTGFSRQREFGASRPPHPRETASKAAPADTESIPLPQMPQADSPNGARMPKRTSSATSCAVSFAATVCNERYETLGFRGTNRVDNVRFAGYTESGGRSYGRMGIHQAVTKHRFLKVRATPPITQQAVPADTMEMDEQAR